MKKLYVLLFICLIIMQGLYWFGLLNDCIVMPYDTLKCCRISTLYFIVLFLIGFMFFSAAMASCIPPNKKISILFSHIVFLSGSLFSLGFSLFGLSNTVSFEREGIRTFYPDALIPYDEIDNISITATRYPFVEKALLHLKNGQNHTFFSDFSRTEDILVSRAGLYRYSEDSADRIFGAQKIIKPAAFITNEPEIDEKQAVMLLCSVEEYAARVLMNYKNTKRKLTEHIEKMFASENPVKRLEILSKYGKNITSSEEQAEFVYLMCCNSIDSFRIINNDYHARKNKSYRRQYKEVFDFICKKYDDFPLAEAYCETMDLFVYPGREVAILAQNFPDSMFTYLALSRAAKFIEPSTLAIHRPLVKIMKNWYDKKPPLIKAKSEAVVLTR